MEGPAESYVQLVGLRELRGNVVTFVGESLIRQSQVEYSVGVVVGTRASLPWNP